MGVPLALPTVPNHKGCPFSREIRSSFLVNSLISISFLLAIAQMGTKLTYGVQHNILFNPFYILITVSDYAWLRVNASVVLP